MCKSICMYIHIYYIVLYYIILYYLILLYYILYYIMSTYVCIYIYTCMYKCIYTHMCDLRIPESQMTQCAPMNDLVVIIHNQSRAIPLWCSRYTQANCCLIWMGHPSQHASWYLSRYLYILRADSRTSHDEKDKVPRGGLYLALDFLSWVQDSHFSHFQQRQ